MVLGGGCGRDETNCWTGVRFAIFPEANEEKIMRYITSVISCFLIGVFAADAQVMDPKIRTSS